MRRPWNFNKIGIKTTITKAGLAAVILGLSPTGFALPVPGSQITNIASGDFVDAQGNLQVVNSNPVSLTIEKVYALTLQQDQQQVALLAAPVAFPHLLSNSGNSPDQYLLTLSQLPSAFNLTGLGVYADRNQDGLADDAINLNNTRVSLEAGESLALVLLGTAPVSASAGSQTSISLQASSQQNPALSQRVTDVATLVDQAMIRLTKAQSLSTGPNGAVITYTLAYNNTGTAAGRLQVSDLLNTSLQYQPGSAVWSAGNSLTDADDSEASSNSGISYRLLNGNQIEFTLDSIAPLSSGFVSFKALVRPVADKKIANTASYSQYNGSAPTPVISTVTNTVVFTRQDQLGVVLNNSALDSRNNGNPASSPDNLIVKNAVVAGQTVSFDNYVWNTGNSSDSYNLSYSASNLPACAQLQFLAADGRTPLTDSNGDGLIDTGSLASGQARLVKTVLLTTPACSSSSVINIDVQARSVTSSNVTDPLRNQINQIAGQGATDLYNANGSGSGVGNTDNNGTAWLSQPVVAGQTTVLPLVISNTGSSSNYYNLYVSATAISLANLGSVSSLPVGWRVAFYAGDATCSSLGSQMVNSGNIAAGSSKSYCAVVSAPVNASQTALPLWFAVSSPVNGQGDVIKDQVSLPQARRLELSNDQQGQVQAGGTTVYLHTLKNTGAVTEAQNSGDVLLSLQALNVNDGFSYSLYFDANNNGALDSADPIASDLRAIAGSGLSPDQSVQLLVKVQAPASASNGLRSQVQIIVTPTGQVAGLSASSVQNTDTTTVNPNQLRLTKTQAKDELCNSSDFSSLSYSTTGIKVRPNQCVVYRLTVRNEGSQKVDTVIVQDMVPAYTTLLTQPGATVSQGTVSTNNGQIAANVGTLLPQQQASLYFSIRVNP